METCNNVIAKSESDEPGPRNPLVQHFTSLFHVVFCMP
jgi:hypothetical protein